MADPLEPPEQNLDPAAQAEAARGAAAQRVGAKFRGNVYTPETPASQDLGGDGVLPSDRQEIADGEVSLAERYRLNNTNSYFRGSLAGAGTLTALADIVSSPDTPDMDARTKAARVNYRKQYEEVVADLARYDMMQPWGTTFEATVALGGVLTGPLTSPEGLAGVPARGATWLYRTGRAALQQGAIQGAVDPIVQYLNRQAGTEQEYDPWRTATAVGLGAIIGGGLHAGGELFSAYRVRKLRADLAKEDPAFSGETERNFKPDESEELPSDIAEQQKAAEPTEAAQPEKPVEEMNTEELIEHIDKLTKDVKTAAAGEEPAAGQKTSTAVEEALAKIKEALGVAEPEPVRTKGAEPTEAPKGGDVALENSDKFQAAVKEINDSWPSNAIQQKVELFPDQIKLLQDAGFDVAADGTMSAATRIKLTNEAERLRKGIEKPAPATAGEKPPAEWTKVGEQKGSNPGGVYKDAAGEHWYVKTPKSEEHIANERLANELYRMAGAAVPETKAIALDGKNAIASRMLNEAFVPLKDAPNAAWAEKVLRNNFAADAWLANHDVIGLTRDNVMVSPAGEVYRIDQGGAMKFRAQGEPKEFGNFPNEWETMRDPKIAKEAGPVFKGMTKAEKIDSLNRVLLISDSDIMAAAHILGPGNATEKVDLGVALIQRKKFLHDIRDDLLAKGKKKQPAPEKLPEGLPPAPPKAPEAKSPETIKAKADFDAFAAKMEKKYGVDEGELFANASKLNQKEWTKYQQLKQKHDNLYQAEIAAQQQQPATNVVNLPKADHTFPAASVDKAHALGFHLPGDTGSDIAKELGRVWFHGTSAKFDAFNLKFSNNNEKAVFLTPDLKLAQMKGSGGGQIIPLVTRAQKVLIVPVDKGMSASPYNNAKFVKTINEAHAKGYDAVLFKNISDYGLPPADQLAILKPNLLRSIHAQFAPEKKQSAKLAAIFGKKSGEEPIAPPDPEWFGESKVIDKKGEPLVVYHGAGKDFETFEPRRRPGATGKLAEEAREGFFFSDRRKTAKTYSEIGQYSAAEAREIAATTRKTFEGYAEKAEAAGDEKAAADWRTKAAEQTGPTVIPAYVSMQNPLVINMKGKGFQPETWRAVQDKAIADAKAGGHDGVVFRNTFDAGELNRVDALMKGRFKTENIYVPLKPEQIRRADRPANPSTEAPAGKAPAEEFNQAYEAMLAEARNDMVDAQARGVQVTEPTVAPDVSPAKGDLQAMAQRKSGQKLAGEQERPAGGVATPQASPEQEAAIKSLQQQAFDFADAIGFPLRQGRVQMKGALGTFNRESGVVRVKEAPDFEVVAHEAGHAIEQKVGQDITNLHQQFAHELGPLDYDYPNQARTEEGFAEFVRRWIGNPANAQQIAPGFASSFQNLLEQKAPDVLAALIKAAEGYRAYLNAPSVDVIGAVRRSMMENPKHGFPAVAKQVREDGLPATIGTMLQNSYTALLDEKAPVARAVRELGRLIRDADPNHALVNLKAADNPDVLLRLAARAQQGAMRDMMDGTRGYHSTTSQGPSLTDALAKATGGPSKFGKWNEEVRKQFSDYLIARRAEVLWKKFEAGDLASPPASFSKGDAATGMLEFERANPTFREASDMVHAYSREQLKKSFDAGLIDRDLFDRLSKEEFYVPFMRDLSDKPLASEGAGGSSPEGPGMTGIVKKMKGSSRDIIDPIESMMMQTFLVNRTIQHNDVIRAFVRLAEKAGPGGGRYVEVLPAHEAKKYTFDLGAALERKSLEMGVPPDEAKVLSASVADLFGEDPLLGSFYRMEPAGKRGEPLVFYKEDGKLKVARFMSDEEGHALYEILTALPQKLTDAYSELVSAMSSTLRTGITTNPTFAVTNYIRDQVAAAILRPDYIPIASGIKGIKAELTQSETAKLYAAGGGVSPGASVAMIERAVEADVQALARKGYLVNRLGPLGHLLTTAPNIRDLGKGTPTDFAKNLKDAFHGALEFVSITEAGTRNSVFGKVFNAKKAQGLNDYEAMIEAAYQSTDLLDFSRHGSRTLQLRNWVTFINAHFQGLDKAYRTLGEPIAQMVSDASRRMLTRFTGHDFGRSQVFTSDTEAANNALLGWAKLLGGGAILGAGWAALWHDNRMYRDANPAIKGTHVIIPIGNKVGLWPKPFELGTGFTAGEYAYAAWAQDDPRAAEMFREAAWEAIAPPNPITDTPLVKTYFELKTNKNLFTGGDIVPDRFARLPPEQQYTDRTSSMAKAIGNVIGQSPMKVDYAIGAMFGNWGRDIATLSSAVDSQSPAANWEDYVFLRRFIKDPRRTSDVTTKFWKFMSQSTGTYNQDVNGYENLVRQRDDGGAQKFLGRLPARGQAFVVLKSGVDEDGKGYKPDEKRLHPLQRAYDAVSTLNGLLREISDNTVTRWENKDHLPLTQDQRRDLFDNVREISQMEMYNAFIIMKEPGYANRALLDNAPTLEKIRHIAPAVAEEIATRYATAKIRKTTDIAKIYPDMEKALLQFGSEADIGSLAFDVDGFEFDGDKARRPGKRRIPIMAPSSAGASPAPQ